MKRDSCDCFQMCSSFPPAGWGGCGQPRDGNPNPHQMSPVSLGTVHIWPQGAGTAGGWHRSCAGGVGTQQAEPGASHGILRPLAAASSGRTGRERSGGCAASGWVAQGLPAAPQHHGEQSPGPNQAVPNQAVPSCPAPLLHQGGGEGLVTSSVMSGSTEIGDTVG